MSYLSMTLSTTGATATPTLLPPSHPLDSQYDHRSVLEVVGWCMAIMATLVVLARMGTKWSMSRRLGLDDLLITISLLLAFGQTASLSTAVSSGLGLTPQSPAEEAEVDLEGQQKSMYAFNVLFVISQCFAKVSVTVFTGRLTPVRLHRLIGKASIIGMTLWALSAAFALLFQCQLPHPWQTIGGGTCIDRITLYTYIEVVNLLFDVVLIALPVVIVWSLHQKRARKLAILGTFLTRSSVIAVIIVQLAVLHSDSDSPDPFLRWNFAICTQFIEYLSIVSACSLYLGPFVRGAASGMLGHTVSEQNRAQQEAQLRYHFDRDRFARTRTITTIGRELPPDFLGEAGPQKAESRLDIMVTRDFEVHETYDYVAQPDSTHSRQSSDKTVEPTGVV